jgi:hypothetical protein
MNTDKEAMEKNPKKNKETRICFLGTRGEETRDGRLL